MEMGGGLGWENKAAVTEHEKASPEPNRLKEGGYPLLTCKPWGLPGSFKIQPPGAPHRSKYLPNWKSLNRITMKEGGGPRVKEFGGGYPGKSQGDNRGWPLRRRVDTVFKPTKGHTKKSGKREGGSGSKL